MNVTKERIELAKQAIIAEIVKKLSSTFNISTEEALRKFLTTRTYELLKSDTSMLWAETPEYVADMLESEFNNDMEEWLKI